MEECAHRPGRALFGPQLHEDFISLKGVNAPVRQIAVRNIGRDKPTILIMADRTTWPSTFVPWSCLALVCAFAMPS